MTISLQLSSCHSHQKSYKIFQYKIVPPQPHSLICSYLPLFDHCKIKISSETDSELGKDCLIFLGTLSFRVEVDNTCYLYFRAFGLGQLRRGILYKPQSVTLPQKHTLLSGSNTVPIIKLNIQHSFQNFYSYVNIGVISFPFNH